jgi:hypothetical protein
VIREPFIWSEFTTGSTNRHDEKLHYLAHPYVFTYIDILQSYVPPIPSSSILLGFAIGYKTFFFRMLLRYCHTLKYLILECEYLLKCVHLSIGFFKNFTDFSGNYSHLSYS